MELFTPRYIHTVGRFFTRLSNGNTLIGWGRGPTVMATEVSAQGEVVWELFGNSEDGASLRTYRAFRAVR